MISRALIKQEIEVKRNEIKKLHPNITKFEINFILLV